MTVEEADLLNVLLKVCHFFSVVQNSNGLLNVCVVSVHLQSKQLLSTSLVRHSLIAVEKV